jgi:hypothetical protein
MDVGGKDEDADDLSEESEEDEEDWEEVKALKVGCVCFRTSRSLLVSGQQVSKQRSHPSHSWKYALIPSLNIVFLYWIYPILFIRVCVHHRKPSMDRCHTGAYHNGTGWSLVTSIEAWRSCPEHHGVHYLSRSLTFHVAQHPDLGKQLPDVAQRTH